MCLVRQLANIILEVVLSGSGERGLDHNTNIIHALYSEYLTAEYNKLSKYKKNHINRLVKDNCI